jgi:hypothetical protein
MVALNKCHANLKRTWSGWGDIVKPSPPTLLELDLARDRKASGLFFYRLSAAIVLTPGKGGATVPITAEKTRHAASCRSRVAVQRIFADMSSVCFRYADNIRFLTPRGNSDTAYGIRTVLEQLTFSDFCQESP